MPNSALALIGLRLLTPPPETPVRAGDLRYLLDHHAAARLRRAGVFAPKRHHRQQHAGHRPHRARPAGRPQLELRRPGPCSRPGAADRTRPAVLVGRTRLPAIPGATLGLLSGGALLAVAPPAPVSLRIALAGLALMAGTVLVNITPPNPY